MKTRTTPLSKAERAAAILWATAMMRFNHGLIDHDGLHEQLLVARQTPWDRSSAETEWVGASGAISRTAERWADFLVVEATGNFKNNHPHPTRLRRMASALCREHGATFPGDGQWMRREAGKLAVMILKEEA